MKIKVAIITNGAFPVPATKGGAMETLVEQIINQNENKQDIELSIISIFDNDAKIRSKLYKNSHFYFIKSNSFFIILDKILHFIAFNILHLKNHLSFKTTMQRISYIKQVSNLIYHNDFDRLVFENQMASLWALKSHNNEIKYKNKYYFHLHNHPERYAHCEKLAAKSAKIIGVSEFISKAFAKKIGIPFTNDKFAILHNYIDSNIFDIDKVNKNDIIEIKNKYNLNDKKIVLFTGRLIPGKGVKELIQAYDLIESNDTKLVIVGSFNFDTNTSSEYEKEMINAITDKTLDNIIFTGFVPYKTIPTFYAMADIVVLPSTCEDAAPLTVIENLTMHRPLITTTMGGIPEYADDQCAIMLSNDDQLVPSLAKAIDNLLNNQELKRSMSEHASIKTKSWNLQNYYDNFVNIMKDGVKNEDR